MHEKFVDPIIGKGKFMVRQDNFPPIEEPVKTAHKIFKDMYMTQHEVNLKAELSKESYMPNEIVKVNVEVDTRLCTRPIKYFKVQLWRVLLFKLLNDKSEYKRFDDILAECMF